MVQDGGFGSPAPHCRRNTEANAALGGELEGVREQILQHLLQTLGVGDDAASQIGIDVDVKRQLAVVRFMPERTSDRLQQVSGEDFLRIHGDRSGFNLGQVENVADQIEQVGAGAVNGARELDLLPGQVSV